MLPNVSVYPLGCFNSNDSQFHQQIYLSNTRLPPFSLATFWTTDWTQHGWRFSCISSGVPWHTNAIRTAADSHFHPKVCSASRNCRISMSLAVCEPVNHPWMHLLTFKFGNKRMLYMFYIGISDFLYICLLASMNWEKTTARRAE